MSEQEPGAVADGWWQAHRPVSGVEHDPQNGKFHGFCIRCITEWPCKYSPESAHDAEDARRKEEFAAMHAEAARLAGRLIEREEYIDEREALLARLTDLETCSRREVAD